MNTKNSCQAFFLTIAISRCRTIYPSNLKIRTYNSIKELYSNSPSGRPVMSLSRRSLLVFRSSMRTRLFMCFFSLLWIYSRRYTASISSPIHYTYINFKRLRPNIPGGNDESLFLLRSLPIFVPNQRPKLLS